MIKAKDKETGVELEFETLQDLQQYLAQKKGQSTGTTETPCKKNKEETGTGIRVAKEKKKYKKYVPFEEQFKVLLQVLNEANRPLIQEEVRQKVEEKGIVLPRGGTATAFFRRVRERKEIFVIEKSKRKLYYTTPAMWGWFLKAADSNKDGGDKPQKPTTVKYGKTKKGRKRKPTITSHAKMMRERGKFVAPRANYLMKQMGWSREKAMKQASIEWNHRHNKKVKVKESPNDVLSLSPQDEGEVIIDGNAVEKDDGDDNKGKHFPELVGVGDTRHKKKLKFIIKWLLKNPLNRKLSFSMFQSYFGFRNITEWDYFIESFKMNSDKIARYFGVEDNFRVIYGGIGKDREIAYVK